MGGLQIGGGKVAGGVAAVEWKSRRVYSVSTAYNRVGETVVSQRSLSKCRPPTTFIMLARELGFYRRLELELHRIAEVARVGLLPP